MEVRGSAAIREYYAEMLKMVTIKDMTVSASQYHTSGDVSFGWFRWTMVAVPSDSPSPMTIEGRATAFARKIGGKWLYVNDHASVPAPAPPQAPSAKSGGPAK
jgi:ketosteroid isomerase-like protein